LTVALKVGEKLEKMPEASVLGIKTSINTYFDVIQGILDNFANARGMDVIYVTSTVPATPILNALKMLDIDLTNTYFVDCISNVLMGRGEEEENVLYIESPTMLEMIILKVEYLIKKTSRHAERKKIVILDSINSLAIHNNTKILSEFLHVLTNGLRAKDAYTVIFMLAEHSSEELENIVAFVCDDVLAVEVEEVE